jgi:glucokinase
VNEDGSVVHSMMLPTLAKDRKVMKQTLFGIRTMLDYAWNERPDLRVEGIGIGSAGQIDFRTGVVISATDLLLDYAGTTDAAANHLICLALGTGVGGGFPMVD